MPDPNSEQVRLSPDQERWLALALDAYDRGLLDLEGFADELAERFVQVWREGWTAAQQIVELEGEKVWAHTVFPEGYEGNPYEITIQPGKEES